MNLCGFFEIPLVFEDWKLLFITELQLSDLLFCTFTGLFNTHAIPQGAVSFTCSEPVDVPVTFSSTGSFLQLPLSMPSDELSISLEFRTWNKAGLLLTFDLQQQAGSTWLYLSEAQVRLQIHKAGRVLVNIIAG